MESGDIALGLVTLIYGPLIFYPILVALIAICLLVWLAMTKLCRAFGWRSQKQGRVT